MATPVMANFRSSAYPNPAAILKTSHPYPMLNAHSANPNPTFNTGIIVYLGHSHPNTPAASNE